MSFKKHIHIISFDIPYPPIYGGVIDVFCKLKNLSTLGYEISLHCFQYKGKEESTELEKYCKEVIYYPRKKAYQVFFTLIPYIVSSRENDDLLGNLLKDDDTILFEGLHTCAFLDHPLLKGRNKIVWMHNIEWDYYRHLSKADQNFIHKIHFNIESKKLKHFESKLKQATTIFCINQGDAEYMSQYAPSKYIPSFHLNEEVTSKVGRGEYILYHGSLDVVENHQAAIFLINKVFFKLEYKVIIAGKNPKSSLEKIIKNYPHISLEANLPQDEFDKLIENAHCNVLMSFQATGLKMKVINALYKGRFVIVNNMIISHSGLESIVIVANSDTEFIHAIKTTMKNEFSEKQIEDRKAFLEINYSNQSKINKITPYL